MGHHLFTFSSYIEAGVAFSFSGLVGLFAQDAQGLQDSE